MSVPADPADPADSLRRGPDTRSGRLWAHAGPALRAIERHPFLAGLADGTLDPARFAHYVSQDALYLVGYARALAALASRADDPQDVAMFARHAAGALEVERTLHESLLPQLGLDAAVVGAAEPAPTTAAYLGVLLATVHSASYPVGVAAVLPCYWIYAHVGRRLAASGSPDPRYQRWIDAYAGEDYVTVVAEVLDATDRLHVDAGVEAAMARTFAVTARYEWMFWDMGWRCEGWPFQLRPPDPTVPPVSPGR